MTDPAAPSPHAQLLPLITGHWATAAIHAFARLGIADLVEEGPRSCKDLAEDAKAHAPSLFRLLRAVASLGLLRETEPQTFELTEVGALMRTKHPRSLRDMALFFGSPPTWNAWGSFLHSVRTGESAFEHVHGKSFRDYLKKDGRLASAYGGAMNGLSRAAAEDVLAAYTFMNVGTLVDVGGGHGEFLSRLLARHPDMQGVLFDLPEVIEGAHAVIEEAGLRGRCELVGGDFFKAMPEGDTYVSKHIMRDWDDEACGRILRGMHRAMQGDGKVLLVEGVVPGGDDSHPTKLFDLERLTGSQGGRERTQDEFEELLLDAGFKLSSVTPTRGAVSVIEGVKA